MDDDDDDTNDEGALLEYCDVTGLLETTGDLLFRAPLSARLIIVHVVAILSATEEEPCLFMSSCVKTITVERAASVDAGKGEVDAEAVVQVI